MVPAMSFKPIFNSLGITSIPHPAGVPSKLSIFPGNDFLENQIDATSEFQAGIIFFNNYNINLS